MSKMIAEQQFHYITKMTSDKHFPNVIYANRNAKLEKYFTWGWWQSSLRSQNLHLVEFSSGEIFH